MSAYAIFEALQNPKILNINLWFNCPIRLFSRRLTYHLDCIFREGVLKPPRHHTLFTIWTILAVIQDWKGKLSDMYTQICSKGLLSKVFYLIRFHILTSSYKRAALYIHPRSAFLHPTILKPLLRERAVQQFVSKLHETRIRYIESL